MLKERVRTAIVLGVILLAILFLVPVAAFTWIALAIFVYGAYEWSKLVQFSSSLQQAAYVTSTAVLALLVYVFGLKEQLWQSPQQLSDANFTAMSIACVWWAISSLLVLVYPSKLAIWKNSKLLKGVFGYLTLIPAWLALVTIRQWQAEVDVNSGVFLTLFVFGIVWSADVGAYFVGKRFGKNKLMPNVSPGKTIEGFAGGMAAVAIFSLVVFWAQDIAANTWLLLVLSTVVIGVVSAFGDLSESMFKRNAGIKDSGSIFPGHGGLLDRIDSLNAAMPVFLVLFTLFFF